MLGIGPRSARNSSRMRTVLSLPDSTARISLIPSRSSLATTLSLPCRMRKQREVSGSDQIKSNSWGDKPNPRQYSLSCAFGLGRKIWVADCSMMALDMRLESASPAL